MLKVTQLYGFGGGATAATPPAFKSASNYNGSAASSHTITLPGTYAVGDLLLCNASNTGIAATTSSFTGWTLIAEDTGVRLYYRIATGSDTATLVISASRTLEASIAAYGPTSGTDGTPNGQSGVSGDITLSAITVGTSGGMLIATSSTANTVLTPSGFAQDSFVTPSTKNFYFFSKSIAATGSTGTVLLDESSTGTQGGALIYIKP